FWPSLTPRHEKSFLAVHPCTRENPERGYAENAGRPKSVSTRRVEAWRSRANIASKACSSHAQSQSDNHDSRFRPSRNCNPHDLPFCPIIAPTAARISASACGTAVAQLCKLFEELV